MTDVTNVTQADRNAAVRLLEAGGQDWQAKEIRLGNGDHFPIVQAFARHRIEAEARTANSTVSDGLAAELAAVRRFADGYREITDDLYARILSALTHTKSVDVNETTVGETQAGLSLTGDHQAKSEPASNAMREALAEWLIYDQLLRNYEGPLSVLCAGDVAKIDTAYDRCVTKTRAALSQSPDTVEQAVAAETEREDGA